MPLETVNMYERGSGAKLNTTKSEAMWVGRWRANGASPFGLQWVNKLRILGVYFSNGLVAVDEENWRLKLDKLKGTLGLWWQRDFSFLGRGMTLNVLGARRFWHVAKVLPPQNGFLLNISELFGLLCGNPSPKLSAEHVAWPPSCMGV